MYRHISLYNISISFIEGSNDKVSIPEIASFWDKKFIVDNKLIVNKYAFASDWVYLFIWECHMYSCTSAPLPLERSFSVI